MCACLSATDNQKCFNPCAASSDLPESVHGAAIAIRPVSTDRTAIRRTTSSISGHRSACSCCRSHCRRDRSDDRFLRRGQLRWCSWIAISAATLASIGDEAVIGGFATIPAPMVSNNTPSMAIRYKHALLQSSNHHMGHWDHM